MVVSGFIFGVMAEYTPPETSMQWAFFMNILNSVCVYILCFGIIYYKTTYRMIEVVIKASLPKKLKHSKGAEILCKILVGLVVGYLGFCLYLVSTSPFAFMWLVPLVSIILFLFTAFGLYAICAAIYFLFVAFGLWSKWLFEELKRKPS
ncbi:MAG: hypothetical protein E7012_06725 [Alphaproteobacteria bacterium]|nr:hypothetical protein [Alphaproteobacteria bacterium]